MQNSTTIADALLKKGMIVRNLSGYGLNAIRVTIGTPEQNNRFFELTTELL
jgi:histidinol-phosphate aminotransferase